MTDHRIDPDFWSRWPPGGASEHEIDVFVAKMRPETRDGAREVSRALVGVLRWLAADRAVIEIGQHWRDCAGVLWVVHAENGGNVDSGGEEYYLLRADEPVPPDWQHYMYPVFGPTLRHEYTRER